LNCPASGKREGRKVSKRRRKGNSIELHGKTRAATNSLRSCESANLIRKAKLHKFQALETREGKRNQILIDRRQARNIEKFSLRSVEEGVKYWNIWFQGEN